jgi:hypothetical protein
MKKQTTDTIQERLTTRQEEIEATFAEMIDVITRYSRVAPLGLIGDENSPADYVLNDEDRGAFNKFSPWIERWMGVIYPDTVRNQQRIADGDFKLNGNDDPDAVYMNLAFDAQRFGFLYGYLVGCQTMGADSKVLMAKAEGFVIQQIHRG